MIGLEFPSKVEERDVAQIRIALKRLSDVAKTKDLMLSRADALTLLDVKDNYFLWALGATGLAAIGDKEAADRLLIIYRDGELTPRQVAWIDHCVGNVLPRTTAFPISTRHQLLLNYLRRKD